MTDTMMSLKGSDYVVAWPQAMADKYGLSVTSIARTVAQITGVATSPEQITSDAPIPAIAALTPEQAKRVAARLRVDAIDAGLFDPTTGRRRSQDCHYCGQPMRGGQCRECV